MPSRSRWERILRVRRLLSSGGSNLARLLGLRARDDPVVDGGLKPPVRRGRTVRSLAVGWGKCALLDLPIEVLP